jgi:hypothetical protein
MFSNALSRASYYLCILLWNLLNTVPTLTQKGSRQT